MAATSSADWLWARRMGHQHASSSSSKVPPTAFGASSPEIGISQSRQTAQLLRAASASPIVRHRSTSEPRQPHVWPPFEPCISRQDGPSRTKSADGLCRAAQGHPPDLEENPQEFYGRVVASLHRLTLADFGRLVSPAQQRALLSRYDGLSTRSKLSAVRRVKELLELAMDDLAGQRAEAVARGESQSSTLADLDIHTRDHASTLRVLAGEARQTEDRLERLPMLRRQDTHARDHSRMLNAMDGEAKEKEERIEKLSMLRRQDTHARDRSSLLRALAGEAKQTEERLEKPMMPRRRISPAQKPCISNLLRSLEKSAAAKAVAPSGHTGAAVRPLRVV